MFEFIIRVIGSLLIFKAEQKVVDYLLEPSTFEKNVVRLKQEEWFSLLVSDYRYEHTIRYNSKVKQFLEDPHNADRLVNDQEEQKKFVALVHRERAKQAR
ncbi:hypothetical protein [Planomicrobium sp. CPCC 101079]|uniref:hypothetical protein n=1 Tax=Planomicrobium sp. CPCC 101079 TaxID=2599618 RepID=UPI0011B58C9D|nr:hypothetical protein [Planomicrobium sp. CPCC 101079]TWT09349.1 hypothetical protein FQV28_06870 [Planomicrobium sp. CPCC 101079]